METRKLFMMLSVAFLIVVSSLLEPLLTSASPISNRNLSLPVTCHRKSQYYGLADVPTCISALTELGTDRTLMHFGPYFPGFVWKSRVTNCRIILNTTDFAYGEARFSREAVATSVWQILLDCHMFGGYGGYAAVLGSFLPSSDTFYVELIAPKGKPRETETIE